MAFLGYFYWDPPREMLPFNIPLLGRPLLWYGFFFALGFFVGYWIVRSLLKCYFFSRSQIIVREKDNKELEKKISFLSEKMTFYVLAGAIVGSRLGDLLFYQNFSTYIHHPLDIFKVWEGGLASHGGAFGIMAALCLLSKRLKTKYPVFSWKVLLDFTVVPTALAGGLIRIGNFFNQEILGTIARVPWAIIFGHPVDGGAVLPRHPVQLYESLCYFFVFFLLYHLYRSRHFFRHPGKISGLFLILVFGFRFCIEFFKVEQSELLKGHAFFSMGQYLSLPLIFLGVWLFLAKKPFAVSHVEGN